VEANPNASSGKKQEETRVKIDMGFLADNAEQIEDSMKKLGPLRDQLYEAFREVIARAKRNQHESVINKTGELDSAGNTPLKRDKP
jgi:hypothetical protein